MGAKQFPNGCQAVAVTAGHDLPVIVEMMPFPLLIWYAHLCQHNTTDSQSSQLKQNNTSEWESVYCYQSHRGLLFKMFIHFSKLYLYVWFAPSIIDTDTANVNICCIQEIGFLEKFSCCHFIPLMLWSPPFATGIQLSWSEWHLWISQYHNHRAGLSSTAVWCCSAKWHL